MQLTLVNYDTENYIIPCFTNRLLVARFSIEKNVSAGPPHLHSCRISTRETGFTTGYRYYTGTYDESDFLESSHSVDLDESS